MRKNNRLIYFLIIVAVLAFSSMAFAGARSFPGPWGPYIGELIAPGNLAAPTDTHLIRHARRGHYSSKFDYIVDQDKDDTDEINLLDFSVALYWDYWTPWTTAETLLSEVEEWHQWPEIPRMDLWNEYGDYLGVRHGWGFDSEEPEGLGYWPEKHEFNKVLIRTIAPTVDLSFTVEYIDWDTFDDHHMEPFWFGLVGGYEYTVAPTERVLAQDCTLACEYYYHYMQSEYFDEDYTDLPVTMEDIITWTGTGDQMYYVECCDNFALALSGDDDGWREDRGKPFYDWTFRSREMVVAHLSETPFVRVRTTEAENVDRDCRNDISGHWHDNRDFRAWADSSYFDSIVDVPEGETFYMGVQYADETDCTCCPAGACCNNDYIPFIAVTNLGTELLYIGDNLIDSEGLVLWDNDKKVYSNNSWLCNSWCGLCEYDDFMSGDKGALGAGQEENIADQSSLASCPCRLYPAFTNTVKAAGNMDINYRASKVDDCVILDPTTRIMGRFNTSWSKYPVSGLCDCCFFLYDPCDCIVEMYRNALDEDVDFVVAEDLSTKHFNNKLEHDPEATATDYAVWDVEIEDTASRDILLARLEWTVPAASLVDAGLVDGENWWRADLWNKLSIRINGMTLNTDNVENVSANDLTPEELSFLTVVDGPQRDLTVATDIDVKLFVFVVDSDMNAIKYYKNAKGNRFLVVYDGDRDGMFTYKAYISRGAGSGPAPTPEDFDVTVSALLLNLAVPGEESEEIGTVNVPLGGTVVWTVTSTDLAMVSPEVGPVTTVTGLQVGQVIVRAMISGDEDVSADCLVTIEDDPTPTPTPGGGSSGCNAAGFTPAILLLIAPLAIFLKK